MILRILLFVLMGGGLIGFGAYTWRGMHRPAVVAAAPVVMAPVRPAPMAGVLVASHDLGGGTFLKAADLATASVPAGSVGADAERDTPAVRSALAGGLVRRSLVSGQAITAADVLLPGEHGFLAAILDPGMRAFTITRDDILADPGLIWPGDRLDLILTQTAADASAGRKIVAETVLTDVRVLAVDQKLVHGAAADGDKAVPIAAITVEVTPSGADQLAVALRLGKLDLAVRPVPAAGSADARLALAPASGTRAVGTASVWSGDVMDALNGATDGRGAVATVHVFGAHGDAKEFHF